MITLGAVIQAFGYVFLVPAFPFPVMYVHRSDAVQVVHSPTGYVAALANYR